MQKIAEAFPGVPKLANIVGGGKTPLLPDEELKALGYQLVIHPVYLLGAAVSAMQAATKKLLNEGVEQSDVADLEQLNTLVDFPAVWALDEFE